MSIFSDFIWFWLNTFAASPSFASPPKVSWAQDGGYTTANTNCGSHFALAEKKNKPQTPELSLKLSHINEDDETFLSLTKKQTRI